LAAADHGDPATVVLGLTGGIACGKSTVAGDLSRRGALLIDADVIARQVVQPGSPGLAAVAERFGAGVLLASGELDRARLGALVFADEAARRDLNALLHPQIRANMLLAVQKAQSARRPLCVLDAALLLEMGLRDACHEVWTVECGKALQVARLVARNGLTPQAAAQRVDAQWTASQRQALADVTIDNRGTLAELAATLEAAWRELTGRFAVLAAVD